MSPWLLTTGAGTYHAIRVARLVDDHPTRPAAVAKALCGLSQPMIVERGARVTCRSCLKRIEERATRRRRQA